MEALGVELPLLVTQIVNFLIILFILQKFLYRPILSMLDKRKKEIEEGLSQKEKIQQELDKTEKSRIKILKEAREETQRMLRKALDDGKKITESMVAEERTRLKEEREKLLQEIAQERQKTISRAQQQALSYAVLISEQILGEKIGQTEQQKLIKEAIVKLREI